MTTEDAVIIENITTILMIPENITTTSVIPEDINTTTVIFRPNCTEYNPCGRYGYCRDNLNDEWTCVCKFWWNGTLCNELSDSGKQVIALGVMLGILVILFYGLALFRSISKRRKQSKDDSEQNIPKITQKSSIIPITVLHPFRRILSWITGIVTLILATSTLLAKWAIIKPIHEDIVNKFNNHQPLFFKRHSICRTIDLIAEFNLFIFPAASLLLLIFIIITKRVSFQRNNYCKGYFGIPIPADFFGHVKRTLAAVIFAVFADDLLNIALKAVTGDSSSTNEGIVVSYLIEISKLCAIGFHRYPILAAVYIDNILSLICATLYVWLDFSITIVDSGLCRNNFYINDKDYNKSESNSTAINLSYYGTGRKLLFFQLFIDIPRYVCLAYISVKLPILLFKRIRHRNLTDRQLTREQKTLLYSSLPHSAETRYVKKLLGMNHTEAPKNRFVQIFRFIYTWRDDFRFSSRVICVYASIFVLLFFLTVQACLQFLPYINNARENIQQMLNLFSSMADTSDPNLQEVEDPSSNFRLPDFIRAYLIAVFTGLIVTVTQLLIMLVGIRRNLLQAFRGDDSEIPRRNSSQNVNYATGNFHFAGYLIGYVILGDIIVIAFALVIAMTIDSFLVYGNVKLVETILKGLIPFLLFAFFKTYLNKVLARYVFLQHHGEVLSVNNRRAFMVFIYFNVFLDAFLGLVAALGRISQSIVGGMIYMSRLDYSPMGRKLETMDEGFNAYCGFIHMECAHRHPILLCFASHLLRDHLYRTTKRLSKARHKWYLAVFLLSNPTLIYRRKEFLSHLERNEITMMLIGKKNTGEMYIEKPPIIDHHRASIISEKGLEDLWERQRF